MERPHAVDDFTAIRARIKELRMERLRSLADENPPPAIDGAPDKVTNSRTSVMKPGIPGFRVRRRRPMLPD
jgi:hypothetical protein